MKAKRYTSKEMALIKRCFREGDSSFERIAKEVSAISGIERSVAAIKAQYWNLRAVSGTRVRRGMKIWDRFQVFMKKILEENLRLRAELESKRGRKRFSARIEPLRKKIKAQRDEIVSLKAELKSHVPLLKWYQRTQRALKSAGKALINPE